MKRKSKEYRVIARVTAVNPRAAVKAVGEFRATCKVVAVDTKEEWVILPRKKIRTPHWREVSPVSTREGIGG